MDKVNLQAWANWVKDAVVSTVTMVVAFALLGVATVLGVAALNGALGVVGLTVTLPEVLGVKVGTDLGATAGLFAVTSVVMNVLRLAWTLDLNRLRTTTEKKVQREAA